MVTIWNSTVFLYLKNNNNENLRFCKKFGMEKSVNTGVVEKSVPITDQ